MDCLVLPLCKLTEGRAVGEKQRNSVFFHLKCLGFPNKVMLWRELLQFVFVKDLWCDYGSQNILHRKYVVGNETWEWFSSVVLEILQRLKKKIEVSFSLWALMWLFFVVFFYQQCSDDGTSTQWRTHLWWFSPARTAGQSLHLLGTLKIWSVQTWHSHAVI